MKNLISTVISRRTLQIQKECSAYLFSSVEVNSSTHYNKTLQGFSISGGSVSSMAQAEELVKDLDDIFINLLNSRDGSEILFVQGSKETLNAWYKMMWEGKLSREWLAKFGIRPSSSTLEEQEEYMQTLKEEYKEELIQI